MQLTANYSLIVEPHNKNVRLMVSDNGVEIACRKETLENLSKFIQEKEGRIFKGRLQLYKHGDVIAIEVKGNTIATINATRLLYSINEAFKQ